MSSLRDYGTFDLIFGDASDGDVTVTGSLILTRDVYYDVLTLSASSGDLPHIATRSFRLHARHIIFQTSGSINNNASSSSSFFADGGNTPRTGSLASGREGGEGFPITGFPGFSVGASYGGAGGVGGSGSFAGGAGGAVTLPRASSGSIRHIIPALVGYVFGVDGPEPIYGGAGGGGGGGDASFYGGGGGGGGGVLLIAAKMIDVHSGITGTFSANGGIGSNGEPSATSAGSGGGGGGGVVIIVSSARPPLSSSTNFSGTLLVMANGGLPGIPVGTGLSGSPGSSGSIFFIDV